MTNNPLNRTKTSPATSLFFFKSIFDCQLEKEIHNWFLRESLMCTFDFTVTLRIHRNNSWAPVSSQRGEEQNCILRSCRSFRIILCLWTCQPFPERLRLSWGFFMWLLSGWGRRGTAVIDTHWPLHRTLRPSEPRPQKRFFIPKPSSATEAVPLPPLSLLQSLR